MDDLDTLAQSWETYLRAEGKSTNTIRTYLNSVAAFTAWLFETNSPAELTRQNVAAFTADSLADRCSPATANVRHRSLRRFAGWLADEGILDSNPLAGMRQPKVDSPVVPKLSDDELAALIAACKGREFRDRRDEAIVRVMAETGARADETVGMTLADVDVRRGLAVITRGKGGTGRVVPFSAKAGVALDRYLRLRRSHQLAGTEALWLGDRGKGLGYDGLYTALRKRADAAGIEGFHPHRLRHTAASRWLRAGGSEGGLMAVAGWRSRAMLDRYVADTAGERAAEESRGLGLGDM
jgi:site-specific recombinase XerD